MPEPPLRPRRRRTADYPDVLSKLETFCATLPVGARLPTHTSLMRQFAASERTVLRALEELHRCGRVIRRNGAGTFVAQREEAAVTSSRSARARCVVALAEPGSLFFDRCVAELFRCAEAEGVSLVCRPIRPGSGSANAVVLGPASAFGYLVFDHSLVPLAEQLQREGQRVVVVGAPPEGGVPTVPCVYGDPEHGGYLAVRHLLELGHRRLAFCGGPERTGTLRWRGYQRAMQEGRAETTILPPGWMALWAGDPAAAAAHVRGVAAPTAVVAWDDREAVRLLAVLARAGVRVPGEISVVGSDAHPEGERIFPTLTTIEPGWGQQLQAALRLLIGPAPPPPSHATIVVPSLLSRESTCAPAT